MSSAAHDARALVAVDLGAESCRVSLLRFANGEPRAQLVHRFPNAPVATAQGLVWPLEAIEGGMFAGLAQCAALAPEGIRSVAIDGWAVDYVRCGADGAATAQPFCYRDERTLAAEQATHATTPAATLRALTGVQIQRINTAYQLVADKLAGNEPSPWLNLPEYLLTRLGAPPVAELTNASHTQLLALHQPRWSHEAFARMGLDPAHAPTLVAPGTVLGPLRGPLAELPAFRDTLLIAPACHDTASAIAGIAMREQPCAYISSGTWSLIGTVLDAPHNGPAARDGNYTNLAAAGGRTLFHKGVSGMWLLRQCLLHWEQEHAASHDLPALLQAAEAAPAPTRCLDVEDPELLLPGDMPARINTHLSQHRCTPLPTASEAAPLYASLIFHSLAAYYATVLREIQAITGKQFRSIHIVGGGSRNTLLNRLVAERTGLPVVAGCPESSTLGNFAVQLAALDGGAIADAVQQWALRLQDTFYESSTLSNLP